MQISAGDHLGRYELLAPLGAGGMGEVFRARDTVLGREVAVKVLLPEVAEDPDRLERFEREARAVAALKHPNILDIYDFGTDQGRPFAVTELLEGISLHGRIWRDGDPLSWNRAAEIGSAVAAGLEAAHEKGIVHRDLKPGNIFLCADGRIKILDFGLARLLSMPDAPIDSMEETLTQLGLVNPEEAEEESDQGPLTKEGTVLGTAGYMAPEQVRGQQADHRSDIFALGCVLYEMVAAKNPFKRDTGVQTLNAILEDEPDELSSSGIDVPPEYQSAIEKCLQKDPGDRYSSSSQVGEALAICIDQPLTQTLRPGLTLGWRSIAAALAVIVVSGGAAAWWWIQGSGVRWAEREALPEITRLTEAGGLFEAYRLALEARDFLPEDTELQGLVDRITLPISVVTEPAGADVFIKGYSTPDAPWQRLGTTPIEGMRIPYALMRWKISKEGFEDFEGAPFGTVPFTVLSTGFPLDPVGARPAGMVRVPGGPVERPEFAGVTLEPYWIDQFEVTNHQFKAFVDAGGYDIQEYWTEPFLDEQGGELMWDEAMARLRDTTGRPGPADWELGNLGGGRDDYPVGGVSWYEAAAYCQFAGKSLPTVYHWHGATAQDQVSDIVDFSNFGTDGPAPVGSFAGLGDYGTFDMAGNVKEWCWNSSGNKRLILGGAWSEPTYLFKDLDARVPFERSPTHGFRCVRLSGHAPEASLEPVIPRIAYGRGEPVSDEVFEAYRRLYAYDRTALEAKVESVDDSAPYWRKETVSFDAAYGSERVTAMLFLPRDATPPYHAVIWFPGSDVFLSRSADALASSYLFDFIPRSGRALVYPIYQGMYERFAPVMLAPNKLRDLTVMWSKDLERTIDYLEAREDIDHTRLAYYGFSLGAVYGPVFNAIDGRFQAAVLISGGHYGKVPPEIDVVNFAPRSLVPTLMINGEDDFLMPVEISQRPFFDLLGAPVEDKRHALLEGGHLPPDRRAIIREVLDWLDRYLGPVTTSAAGAKTD
ncbi:MAG: protein kinase [Acidobacteria bacterium]|nr:protein kinase [Candidatus Sulfomarinibacter kjeldsenii]